MTYVIGYGSLIDADSRSRTGSSGPAIPVRVRGYRRAWNFADVRKGMTALGLVQLDEASLNGVLVPIGDKDLPDFDRREGVHEAMGYERLQLSPARVALIDDGDPPAGPLWIYVPRVLGTPSTRCPILQSYVDVVMSGCLGIGDSFAAEFVRTTTGWDGPWIDDRAAPRYVRGMTHVPLAAKIDRILRENGAIPPTP